MLKQIAGTTVTRVLVMAMGFFVVILSTRYLGAEEYGNISLFLLSIAIVQLVAGIAGGPALVYLVPRTGLKQLFAGSLVWSLAIHFLAWLVMTLSHTWANDLKYHLLALSFIHYLNTFAFTVLLGQKKVKQFNIILLIQSSFLLLSVGFMLFFTDIRDIRVYVYSLYLSYGLPALVGWYLINDSMVQTQSKGFFRELGKMIRHGGYLQMANAVQLLNYRLSYFFIDLFLGRSFLGIYNAGTQLSEGIWIFGKSFATVQYSSISNSDDPHYAISLSIRLLKLVLLITFTAILVLLMLPREFYELVFGKEFGDVKMVIMFLAPGILFLAGSQIFSHYFSGTGRQQHNAVAAIIGLAVTGISGLTLIPALGLAGAGLTASFAYTVITIYQWIVFVRISKSRISDFLITLKDFREFWILIQNLKKNQELD